MPHDVFADTNDYALLRALNRVSDDIRQVDTLAAEAEGSLTPQQAADVRLAAAELGHVFENYYVPAVTINATNSMFTHLNNANATLDAAVPGGHVHVMKGKLSAIESALRGFYFPAGVFVPGGASQ